MRTEVCTYWLSSRSVCHGREPWLVRGWRGSGLDSRAGSFKNLEKRETQRGVCWVIRTQSRQYYLLHSVLATYPGPATDLAHNRCLLSAHWWMEEEWITEHPMKEKSRGQSQWPSKLEPVQWSWPRRKTEKGTVVRAHRDHLRWCHQNLGWSPHRAIEYWSSSMVAMGEKGVPESSSSPSSPH